MVVLLQRQGIQRNVTSKVLCKITKLICGKYQAHANTIIKDKQGSLLTTESKRNVGQNISERFLTDHH